MGQEVETAFLPHQPAGWHAITQATDRNRAEFCMIFAI